MVVCVQRLFMHFVHIILYTQNIHTHPQEGDQHHLRRVFRTYSRFFFVCVVASNMFTLTAHFGR